MEQVKPEQKTEDRSWGRKEPHSRGLRSLTDICMKVSKESQSAKTQADMDHLGDRDEVRVEGTIRASQPASGAG